MELKQIDSTREDNPKSNLKTEDATRKKKEKGIPIKRFAAIMAAVIVTVSVLLLVCVFFNFRAFSALKDVSEDYITWEKTANDMQQASDYLTEEVRTFSETGVRDHIDNYFNEAHVTHRREKALDYIHELFPDSTMASALENALEKSVALMDVEYYSMRLKIESMGLNVADYPEEVRNVVLSDEDAAASAELKSKKSCEILFDENYVSMKSNISRSTTICLNSLSDELKEREELYSARLNLTLIFSCVLIVMSIIASVIMVLLTSLQVFNPLIRSIPHIERDDPIPVQGAYEFRVLAETYNAMHETNNKNKEKLKYKVDHDALTGVLNRRGFELLREKYIEEKTCLMIIDIDNFKHVNDTFGHLVGDKILVNIVAILKSTFGEKYPLCRMGGDEFVIVFHGVGEEYKSLIKEKINSINENLLKINGDLPAVTLSAGVAFGDSFSEKIFLKADEALYVTKKSGKCGVTFIE